MGKLVLTRRAGESVKLTEPNGDTWFVMSDGKKKLDIREPNGNWKPSFYAAEVIHFAGGSLELRPTKRRWPDQAVLAFDFPRDVKIVRTEIA